MAVSVYVSGVQAVNVQTATVGNPGNAGENSGESEPGGDGPDRICGAVDYVYNIAKSEVTAGQYTEFLNALAATDTYELYNSAMWSDTYGCKIARTGSSGSYSYTVAGDWADRPVNYVSWGDAARFCNWLHNGLVNRVAKMVSGHAGQFRIRTTAESVQVFDMPVLVGTPRSDRAMAMSLKVSRRAL